MSTKPRKLPLVRRQPTDADDKRTWRQRFWAWLGFGPCEPPGFRPDPAYSAVHLVTEARVRLDWRDRLRVLVSGRLLMVTTTKTQPRVKRTESASSVGVLPPGRE
ncbi:MAG: hypothetical protein RJQ08_13730 [Salinisphaeraceae bacterium]